MSSQTTAQNINTELGVSSTSQVALNTTAVRNIACKSSGEISYKDVRWGINFPGTLMTSSTTTTNYATNSRLNLTAINFRIGATATATVQISINSNGNITYTCTAGATTNTKTTTWLTVGSAGSYTAQLTVTSGSTPSGSATGTDLVLSTTRSWSFSVTRSTQGETTSTCSGNLIIKEGSTVLLTRPYDLTATATYEI